MCVGSCSLCVLKLAKEKRRKERKVTNSSLLGPLASWWRLSIHRLTRTWLNSPTEDWLQLQYAMVHDVHRPEQY